MPDPQPDQKRRCPGERYDIPAAICNARQLNAYPKCLLCPLHGVGHAQPPTASDPKVKSSIFRTSSIAGQVPAEINEYVMQKVGAAAAQFLRAGAAPVLSEPERSKKGGASEPKARTGVMVVAHDLRAESKTLARVLCEGASSAGLGTVSIGATSPEILRVTVATGDYGAGAFVGGCHARADFNGARFYRGDGSPLTLGSGLDKIGLIARRVRHGRARTPGMRGTASTLEAYRGYVTRFVGPIEPMRVAIDGSCGIAGRILPDVLSGLPIEIVPVHFDPQAQSPFLGRRFPADLVRDGLARAVRTGGAALGMALDYDGDIAAFCDENGALLRPDVVAVLIAREVLRRRPRARIAYDLRSSAAMREEIKKADGQALPMPADTLALSLAPQQRDAHYAADLQGRHYFRDMFGAESPILALLTLCGLHSRTGEALSRMAAAVARYSYSGEIRYDMPSPEAVRAAWAAVDELYRDADRDEVDGLTVRRADWWFNLRVGAGAPSLELVIEGRTGASQREARRAIEKIIRAHRTGPTE